MKRLMDAVDTDEAFKREGFDGRTANLVRGSKSFGASRSALQAIEKTKSSPCGGMSQGQLPENLK